jgi:hypothetical protein
LHKPTAQGWGTRQKIPNFVIFHFPFILGAGLKRLLFLSGTNMSTETNISALHTEPRTGTAERSTFKVLLAVSICHLLNDTVQSLLPALYPLLRNTFRLDFGQVGLIALQPRLPLRCSSRSSDSTVIVTPNHISWPQAWALHSLAY